MIFLVDDDPVLHILVPAMLPGYLVQSVSSLGEADTLLTGSEDLLLLDMNLGDGSGYQFFQKMKLNPQLQNLPVIMLSAQDEDEAFEGLPELRPDFFLQKPFSADQIQEKVRAVLTKAG
jgi:two-component system, OmpR family, phosphate regulon response regulator PhoB